MGLPGAGKTTLAKLLAPLLNAVHFNADDVRREINKDLGFGPEDRLEHARRMGWLCDQVVKTGAFAIADFVCPTPATRRAFMDDGPAFVVWMRRVQTGRFEDTNALFEPPETCDVAVGVEGAPEYWAERIRQMLLPVFDPQKPTALFLGRYQPFHESHRALIAEGIRRVGQACIAVRNTHDLDDANRFAFEDVKARIEARLRDFYGRYVVVQAPNITKVFHGLDLGYEVEQIVLGDAIQAVSPTAVQNRLSQATS
nr:adenylyl-sulfate kinase [Microvirga zambiensis]